MGGTSPSPPVSGKGTLLGERIGRGVICLARQRVKDLAGANSPGPVRKDQFRPLGPDLASEVAAKRRPPCRHGGLESREETPKEGICGRSCRTAAISSPTPKIARAFFIKKRAIS